VSWQKPRREKPKHQWRPEPEFTNFNEHLKDLDRRGELDSYMAAWLEFEREREGL